MGRYEKHLNGEIEATLRVGDRPETVAFNPNKKRGKPTNKEVNPLDSEEEEAKMLENSKV